MDRRRKLLKHVADNPHNVRFDDLDKLLRWFGFERRDPKRGSHFVYKHPIGQIITVPYRKQIKIVYVKKVVALIKDCNPEEK